MGWWAGGRYGTTHSLGIHESFLHACIDFSRSIGWVLQGMHPDAWASKLDGLQKMVTEASAGCNERVEVLGRSVSLLRKELRTSGGKGKKYIT